MKAVKAVDRLLGSRHDARGAIVVVALVSVLRLALERGLYSGALEVPPIGLMMLVSNLIFYALCFWLFSALLSLLLRRPHVEVGNLVLVGLVIGLVPPLVELYVPSDRPMPFIWYREVSWTFFADDQARGEGIALWLLVAATGFWVWYFTRSVARAVIGVIGAYLMWPGITALVLAFGKGGPSGLVLLGVAVAVWFALRAKALARCLLRLNHGLPHAALALVGAAWVGRSLSAGLEAAMVILLGVFVMLVHNDHHDRIEDEAAGRPPSSERDDVVWSTAFYVLLLLYEAQREPMLALVGGAFLLFGFVYHHPSLRLKERFCLSYLVEGAWAALAFVAGATAGSGLAPSAGLLIPATLVFGGGALLSMPKDWKDVDADRAAKIPTMYVLLTQGGRSERGVHRAIVAAVTLGLLVPAAWVFSRGETSLALALGAAALVPGAVLLGIAERKRAVELALWALTGHLLLLAVAVSAHTASGAALRKMFEPFGVEAIEAGTDFAGLQRGTAGWAVSPRTTADLARIVQVAYANGVPMRTRGRGHSMNGSTLAADGELTIRTAKLVGARFEKPGTITVEAGAALQDVRKALAEHGWDLPVSNGGTSDGGGPSIGGFISAGGFGPGSAEHGGFWENVDAVTLLVADGRLVTLARTDPDFAWLFGAMGQLGIIVEARLDLIPRDPGATPTYPAGQELVVRPLGPAATGPPLYWNTLFVSAADKSEAARALAAIQARYADAITFRPPYEYAIRHRAVVAPLVYARPGDFFAIGIWGDDPRSPEVVHAIDAEVAALAQASGYRRYVQAEVTRGPDAYRAAFGELYEVFQARRRRDDPAALFNRATVFPDR